MTIGSGQTLLQLIFCGKKGGLHHLDVTALCGEGQWTVPKDVLTNSKQKLQMDHRFGETKAIKLWSSRVLSRGILFDRTSRRCQVKCSLFTHMHSEPEHARAIICGEVCKVLHVNVPAPDLWMPEFQMDVIHRMTF